MPPSTYSHADFRTNHFYLFAVATNMSEKTVADVFNSTNITPCIAKAFLETMYNLCVLLRYAYTQK